MALPLGDPPWDYPPMSLWTMDFSKWGGGCAGAPLEPDSVAVAVPEGRLPHVAVPFAVLRRHMAYYTQALPWRIIQAACMPTGVRNKVTVCHEWVVGHAWAMSCLLCLSVRSVADRVSFKV